MTLPQAPRGRAEKRRTHFSYVGTNPGQRWTGYLAGQSQWFECHPKRPCVPCLSAITDDAVRCPICNGTRTGEVVGYVPIYRESDGRPVMVLCYEEVRDKVEKIEFHRRLLVGREPGRGNRIWILAAPDPLPLYTSTLAERMVPADLTDTLLAVWRCPALIDWYRGRVTPSIEAVTPPLNPAEFSPMLRAAAERANVSEEVKRRRNAAGDDKRGPSLIGDCLPHTNGRKPT